MLFWVLMGASPPKRQICFLVRSQTSSMMSTQMRTMTMSLVTSLRGVQANPKPCNSNSNKEKNTRDGKTSTSIGAVGSFTPSLTDQPLTPLHPNPTRLVTLSYAVPLQPLLPILVQCPLPFNLAQAKQGILRLTVDTPAAGAAVAAPHPMTNRVAPSTVVPHARDMEAAARMRGLRFAGPL
jgi:hypothetical protein